MNKETIGAILLSVGVPLLFAFGLQGCGKILNSAFGDGTSFWVFLIVLIIFILIVIILVKSGDKKS